MLRAVVLTVSLLAAGCAVPQRPGKGTLTNLVEANSGRHYWLYLPAQYPDQVSPSRAAKDRPLVVTLHGMKPFDSYSAQIREWQQQADAYGLVVCAPDLHTSDLFMELPLKHVHPYVERDERLILDMIDQVLKRTDADPSRVLITSWSSGGYLAHYLLNRHPERFACLAVRQSNFSSSILDPQQIREIRSLIRELGGSHSVILSTHILPEVEAVCDRVQIMHHGKVVYQDTISALREFHSGRTVVVGLRQPPAPGALDTIAGVASVEPVSSNLFRIRFKKGEDPTDELLRRAVGQGWGLYQIQPAQSTLEDVFLNLTQREDNSASPAR